MKTTDITTSTKGPDMVVLVCSQKIHELKTIFRHGFQPVCWSLVIPIPCSQPGRQELKVAAVVPRYINNQTQNITSGLHKREGTLMQANFSTEVFINNQRDRQTLSRLLEDGGYDVTMKKKTEQKINTCCNYIYHFLYLHFI